MGNGPGTYHCCRRFNLTEHEDRREDREHLRVVWPLCGKRLGRPTKQTELIEAERAGLTSRTNAAEYGPGDLPGGVVENLRPVEPGFNMDILGR